MEPVRIWLNRNYSTAVHLMDLLRDNDDGVAVELFGSHPDPSAPMLTAADHRLRDPDPTAAGFVDEVLELCAAHRIDVMLPVAGQSLIAHRAAEFRAAGTALICPPDWAVDLLADKAATYAALAGSHLVPPWRSVRSAAQFDGAVGDLEPLFSRQSPLVLKPARGVGADGVRFLTRGGPDLVDLLGPAGAVATVGSVREALAAADVVPELLVMPYLDGPETSVDVLAAAGRMLVAVPRMKVGRRRILGGDQALLRLAAGLVERFELDGLVNVQFRLFAGRPVLLEINTRPSGGLHQTALAEVNLPWAAVLVALGHDPGPLLPRLGAEFVTVPAVRRLATGSRASVRSTTDPLVGALTA